jgi:predicted MPP superfamily phosphohydrolase
MKKAGKVLICLALIVIMTADSGVLAAETKGLSFNNGKFKIMVIADIQDNAEVSPYTMEFITAALDTEQPDLVVLTGDNIQGSAPSLIINKSAVKSSIHQFLTPIAEHHIPFAVVMGNHDPETIMSKEEQMNYYMSYDNCLAQVNEIGSSIGNYNLVIDDDQGNPALNLWFFDSNNRIRSEYGTGYAYITDGQINWYEGAQAQLKASNNGTAVPSIVFQHIPVPEIYDLLIEVPKDTSGAVEGYGKWEEHYFVLNPELVTSGNLNEGPCPPDFNNGQFGSWLEQGDVFAAVFGHDHVNDFKGNLEGIDLMYTPGVGFYSYGNGYNRGVRIIELDQNDPQAYSTRLVYYSDLIDEPIPESLMYNGEIPSFIFRWVLIGIVGIVLVSTPIVLLIKRLVKKKARNK